MMAGDLGRPAASRLTRRIRPFNLESDAVAIGWVAAQGSSVAVKPGRNERANAIFCPQRYHKLACRVGKRDRGLAQKILLRPAGP